MNDPNSQDPYAINPKLASSLRFRILAFVLPLIIIPASSAGIFFFIDHLVGPKLDPQAVEMSARVTGCAPVELETGRYSGLSQLLIPRETWVSVRMIHEGSEIDERAASLNTCVVGSDVKVAFTRDKQPHVQIVESVPLLSQLRINTAMLVVLLLLAFVDFFGFWLFYRAITVPKNTMKAN